MNSDELYAQMCLIRTQISQLEGKWFELQEKYRTVRKKEKQIDGKKNRDTLKT